METYPNNQSLAELGLVSAGDLDCHGDASPRLLRALNVPLRKLSPTDLYLLIHANLALPAIVPLIAARLEAAPFLQAAEYPGDLVTALLESDSRYWLENRETWESMLPIVASAMEQAQTTNDEGEVTYNIGDSLATAVLHFMSHHKP